MGTLGRMDKSRGPVLENVAAILRAICPDFPIPAVTIRPRHSRRISTRKRTNHRVWPRVQGEPHPRHARHPGQAGANRGYQTSGTPWGKVRTRSASCLISRRNPSIRSRGKIEAASEGDFSGSGCTSKKSHGPGRDRSPGQGGHETPVSPKRNRARPDAAPSVWHRTRRDRILHDRQ